jgi:hypothetical protein
MLPSSNLGRAALQAPCLQSGLCCYVLALHSAASRGLLAFIAGCLASLLKQKSWLCRPTDRTQHKYNT